MISLKLEKLINPRLQQTIKVPNNIYPNLFKQPKVFSCSFRAKTLYHKKNPKKTQKPILKL